jgi:hypothetical protein
MAVADALAPIWLVPGVQGFVSNEDVGQKPDGWIARMPYPGGNTLAPLRECQYHTLLFVWPVTIRISIPPAGQIYDGEQMAPGPRAHFESLRPVGIRPHDDGLGLNRVNANARGHL